jgi:protein-disulfide isomerase
MVEYSDFQCPYCGAVGRDIMPALRREYVEAGKVMFVFKHFPLVVHPLARGAASAAVCAGQQGKFWQMHDRLFAQPAKLNDEDMRASAGQVGLDLNLYDSCRAGTESRKLVEADASEAEAFKLTGTPTFFFGRIGSDGRVRATAVLSGAKPIVGFRSILDRLLASQGSQ